MTNGEILKKFKAQYPQMEISDFRPACIPSDGQCITIWLKNGDAIIYFPKPDKTEVVVSGNCVVCGKQLNYGRLFVCKECEPCMDFVSRYAKAETFKEKAKCFIAKVLHAHVITPLGRIMLLPKDYNRLAIATGNEDMI